MLCGRSTHFTTCYCKRARLSSTDPPLCRCRCACLPVLCGGGYHRSWWRFLRPLDRVHMLHRRPISATLAPTALAFSSKVSNTGANRLKSHHAGYSGRSVEIARIDADASADLLTGRLEDPDARSGPLSGCQFLLTLLQTLEWAAIADLAVCGWCWEKGRTAATRPCKSAPHAAAMLYTPNLEHVWSWRYGRSTRPALHRYSLQPAAVVSQQGKASMLHTAHNSPAGSRTACPLQEYSGWGFQKALLSSTTCFLSKVASLIEIRPVCTNHHKQQAMLLTCRKCLEKDASQKLTTTLRIPATAAGKLTRAEVF